MTDLDEKLDAVVRARVAGCEGLVSAERLTGGASQETYRVTVRLGGREQLLAMRRAAGGVFRARTQAAVQGGRDSPGLDAEAMLMEAARDVGVPAPAVFYVLTEEDDLGDGFIMEWLEGEALGNRIVKSDEFAALRPRLAYECGKALARIHSIDLEASGLADRLQETTPATYVQQTWDRYKMMNLPQPILDYTGRWLTDHAPVDSEMCLVHNDFRNGNFMVDASGIIGVLDWELAHIGDPMRDLGWICTNAWRFGADLPVGGFGEYEDLFRGYEEVSGRPVDADRVHYWEVFGSFWWAVTCIYMAQLFRAGPDRSIERAVIGRRTSEAQIDCANLLMPGPVDLPQEPSGRANLEVPRADELLGELQNFLREYVVRDTSGRTQFLARVAANAAGIVAREHDQLEEFRGKELSSLQAILDSDSTDLEALRWQLVNELREGSRHLADEQLKSHLWFCAVRQIAIDNPRYSGLKQALKRDGQ